MGLSLALLEVVALLVLVDLYKLTLTLIARMLYSTLPLGTGENVHPSLFQADGN